MGNLYREKTFVVLLQTKNILQLFYPMENTMDLIYNGAGTATGWVSGNARVLHIQYRIAAGRKFGEFELYYHTILQIKATQTFKFYE